MSHFRSSKMFVVVLVIMMFATAAYAFAASNTVPVSHAGEGENTILGYAVTGVTYTYNTADPSVITFVDFTIAPAAVKASASLLDGGPLQTCVLTVGGTHAQCPSGGVTVFDADMLRVVASD